jgi:hypothetical protein
MRSAAGRAAAALVALAALFPGVPAAPDTGQTGATALTLPVAVRPVALAESCVAASGGADSLGYNPAGLAGMGGPEFYALYYPGFAGDTFVGLLGGKPLEGGPPGTAPCIGASVAYYTSGTVEILESTGRISQATAERDLVAAGGVGARVPGFPVTVGAGAKLIYTSLIEEVTGVAVAGDLGVTAEPPGIPLSFGASLQNAGKGMKLGADSDPLPVRVRLGGMWKLVLEPTEALGWMARPGEGSRGGATEVRSYAECDIRPFDDGLAWSGGIEALFASVFALRGGFTRLSRGGWGARHAVTGGLGVRLGVTRVDYAFEALEHVSTHRFGIGISL